MTPAELKRYDIVITTYQTVAGEHTSSSPVTGGPPAAKKQKMDKGLFDVAWKVQEIHPARLTISHSKLPQTAYNS